METETTNPNTPAAPPTMAALRAAGAGAERLLTEAGVALLISRREDACRILADHEGGPAEEVSFSGIGNIMSAAGRVFETVRPGINAWPTGKHGQWDGLPCSVDTGDLDPREVLALLRAAGAEVRP